MAQKVQVLLTCDLHGDDTPGDETLRFAFDGGGYEIDVCTAHAGQMREAFAPYVGAGRRSHVGGGSPRPSGGGSGRSRGRASIDRSQSTKVREWARGRGVKVSDRGRIPQSVLDQFQTAHR